MGKCLSIGCKSKAACGIVEIKTSCVDHWNSSIDYINKKIEKEIKKLKEKGINISDKRFFSDIIKKEK